MQKITTTTTAAVIVLLFAAVVTAQQQQQQQEWVIQLRPGVDAQQFAQEHHMIHLGALDYLPDNFHKFTATSTRTMIPRDSPDVLFSEHQVKRTRKYTRAAASSGVADPLYPAQWHLHTNAFSVDVDHAGTRSGRGVTIAVVDDGLQHTHPDLQGNYVAAHSYDFNFNDPNPTPDSSGDSHGTSAAGVAAAIRRNGHCGQGAAPEASLAGIRLIAEAVTDETEARALSYHAMGNVDIFSCSWGPEDSGAVMERPGLLLDHTLSLYAGGQRGRMGKGTIYVWASGNGRDGGDSCAFDGYASSPYVIAIGAIDHNGDQAWYSEGCAALMAVMPSSGANQGVATVDLLGAWGYDPGECNTRFGGTSAAAPLAAGVIALMLEERPQLTWRDVKYIIAKAAQPIHTEDTDWSLNAAGYRHSHKYGFGMLKVPALLAATRAHTLVPSPHRIYETGIRTIHDPAGYMPFHMDFAINGSNIGHIEHVVFVASLAHKSRGDVVIRLRSPSGITSILAPARPNDRTPDYPQGGWAFTSVRHWGETRADGIWRLEVDDVNTRTAGKYHFHGFILKIFGY